MNRTARAAAMFASGCALGWLTGLSLSPVIQTVLTSVLGVTVALTSLVVGLPSEGAQPLERTLNGKIEINVAPLAALLIGLALFSPLGIYARTHEWFGSGKGTREAASPEEIKSHEGALFAAPSADECLRFKNKAALGGDELQRELAAARDQHIRDFAKQNSDGAVLKSALEELICPAQESSR
jgi:hypothetical protein